MQIAAYSYLLEYDWGIATVVLFLLWGDNLMGSRDGK